MLVSDSQPFPFNYAAYDGLSNLFVAGKVYDHLGNLLMTVAMTHVANGMYRGQYQGVSGENYFVSTAVYTDGTYATLDPNRSPGGDDYQCVKLAQTAGAFTTGLRVLRGRVVQPIVLRGVVIDPPILRGKIFCGG